MLLEVIGSQRKINEKITPLKKRNRSKKHKRKRIKLKEIYKWKIKVGITGYFKYTGIRLSGLIQEIVVREIIPFVFLQGNFI